MGRFLIAFGFLAISFNQKIVEIGQLSLYSSFIVSLITTILIPVLGIVRKKLFIGLFCIVLYAILLHPSLGSFSFGLTLWLFIIFSFIRLKQRDYPFVLGMFLLSLVITDLRVLYDSEFSLAALSASNRLDSEFCGGVNNLGYFNSIGFIIASGHVKALPKFALSVFFIAVTVLTLSRGALIVLAFFVIMNFSYKYLLSIFTIVIVGVGFWSARFSSFFEVLASRYVFTEVTERAGRSDIWLSVLEHLMSWRSIMGYGLGNFEHNYKGDINVSIHNQYLDFIYVFGLLITLIVTVVWFLSKKYTSRPVFIKWLGYALFISLAFDSRLYVIQTVIWSGLLFNIYINWSNEQSGLYIYN